MEISKWNEEFLTQYLREQQQQWSGGNSSRKKIKFKAKKKEAKSP